MTATVAWDAAQARACIEATVIDLAARYDAADIFDRAHLAGPAVIAAHEAVNAAWRARDLAAVEAACARYREAVGG